MPDAATLGLMTDLAVRMLPVGVARVAAGGPGTSSGPPGLVSTLLSGAAALALD